MTYMNDAKTKLLGLFADPAEHSKSPAMYNPAFEKLGLNMTYLSFQVDPSTLENAIKGFKALNMVGANISMPNKVEVIKYLDKIDKAAELIGAVNCIVNDNGTIVGYNTDGVGYCLNLKENDIDLKDKKLTLIGVGGAGTAIAVQSALEGLRELSIFNIKDASFELAKDMIKRTQSSTNCKINLYDLADTEKLRSEIESSDILTNATSIGMGRFEGKSVIPDKSYFRKDLIVTDTIYAPAITKFIEMANEVGCKTINGEGMLKNQGKANFKLWTGNNLPE